MDLHIPDMEMLGCPQPHLWTSLQLLSMSDNMATAPGRPKVLKIILSAREDVWFHCLPLPVRVKAQQEQRLFWSFWIPNYLEQSWPKVKVHWMVVWKHYPLTSPHKYIYTHLMELSYCLCNTGTRSASVLLPLFYPQPNPTFLEVLLSVNLHRNSRLLSSQLFSQSYLSTSSSHTPTAQSQPQLSHGFPDSILGHIQTRWPLEHDCAILPLSPNLILSHAPDKNSMMALGFPSPVLSTKTPQMCLCSTLSVCSWVIILWDIISLIV